MTKTRRIEPLIKPGQIDDLLILEAEYDLLSPDERHVVDSISDKKNTSTPFLPASSCRRRVYLLRKSDIRAESTPELFSFIQSDKSDHRNIRLYERDDAMTFLVLWMSGSLNKSKHYHDTYNRKTVDIGFEEYERLVRLFREADGDFKTFYTSVTRVITKEGKDGAEEKMAESTNIRPAAGSDLISASADSAEVRHRRDAKHWKETKIAEFRRIKDLGINRFKNLEQETEFLALIKNVRTIANSLRSILQKLKEDEMVKKLWSNPITKNVLERIASSNNALFREIVKCRQDFVKAVSRDLVMAAKDSDPRALAESMSDRVNEAWREKILALSEAAQEFVSSSVSGSVTKGEISALRTEEHDKKI